MSNLRFQEKWDGIARSRGFESLRGMMNSYQEKHTNKEIAELLGVSSRTIELIWVRLGGEGHKRKSQRDGDGFNKTNAKEKWIKLLSEKGFQTLREAATHYKENKFSIERMAKDFGVTPKSLKKRLESAGVMLPKEEDKIKNLNPLGLL